MSDVIDTGSRRSLPEAERPRAEAIGKKRRIDRSEDELELGRFVGDTHRKPASDDASSGRRPEKGEVVGPKRRNVDAASPQPKTVRSKGEIQIAAPLVIDDDATPRRARARRRSLPLAGEEGGWGRLGVLALLSVLLVVLTAATFLLMPRYDTLGDPLVADPAFTEGLIDWQQAGLISVDKDDPAQVQLESINPGTRTFLLRDIALPSGETMLILRAQVQGNDVVPGPELWDSARIYLAQLDADGEPDWKADHNLFTLNGTTDVRNYRRAFTIPADVARARLGIEMKNATGSLSVSKLELTVVEYKMPFLIAVGCLLAGWTVLVVYTGFKTFGGIESTRIKLCLGVAAALSVVALMLPGNIHDIGTGSIAARIGLDDVGVDSIGHGVMFTVLTFLVRMGRPSDPLWLHVGVWGLIAMASEVLQLFTVGRNPSLDDLWVDGIGIVLGLTLAEIARRVRRLPAT